ncbi:C40 family peptidase [Streptomyces sp. ISL-11]|uniref:C40 family peptidase n=1 Tax=Streptomyces sp. ISL-11 TaxID=2819174 RepID=UPI001BE7E23B|nr:C40 family peptidase [Streptomyces sp. ISL-11]MBT2382023.1 C40 family peptidase [Streptomyces sp. ISL-11]
MPGRFARSVRAAALAAGAASLVLPAPPASAAPADPPDQPVSVLLARLQTLYVKAEEATETYNATEEKLKRQRTRVTGLDHDLAAARAALADSLDDAGRLAREQYQGTRNVLSPSMGFLLSRDPAHAFDHGHQLGRAAGRRAATIVRLTDNAERRTDLAVKAHDALTVREALAAQQKKERDAVRKSLARVERMLASLSGEQLAELWKLEQRSISRAQRELLASGRLSGAGTPSAAGGRALAYAYEQIGKPYVWGSEGPDSFDCSGLTSQAWAHAGDVIPRTSQEQWKSLPKVPLSQLRPGDLVVYFQGATHVALYIGDGMVIQAPRPGARVKVSPIAANPLLGAVRPDAGRAPLRSYVPPRLPDGAANGSDTGYGSVGAPSKT